MPEANTYPQGQSFRLQHGELLSPGWCKAHAAELVDEADFARANGELGLAEYLSDSSDFWLELASGPRAAQLAALREENARADAAA